MKNIVSMPPVVKGVMRLKPDEHGHHLAVIEERRVCASCGWVWKYSDLGFECPRCLFGSYPLDKISDQTDFEYYTSLRFWKERTHLPEVVADWIISVHHQSKALEDL